MSGERGRAAGGGFGGIMVVDKPGGVTSRAVVDRVVRLVGRAKVGHAGTLDPLASGVLVVCVGPATRLVEDIQALPKSYRTVVRLGARSDTLDADGRIELQDDPPVPSPEDVAAAAAPLVGDVEQVPPEFSALKVGGRRAYELRGPDGLSTWPRAGSGSTGSTCSATNGPAWSWRSIAARGRTSARSPGISARRWAAAGWWKSWFVPGSGRSPSRAAVGLDAITAESLPGLLRSAVEAVAGRPRWTLDPSQVAAIAAGRRLPAEAEALAGIAPGPIALLDGDGRLVALAEADPACRWIQPRKVFVGQ